MEFMALPDAGAVRLRNVSVPACLVGAPGSLARMSLTILDGRIATEDAAVGADVDMCGAMVFPAFIDMHTHLDKAQMWGRTRNPDGTFDGAINAVNSDKPGRWDRADLMPRMSFALRSAYAHGTRAIRTHLDYFGAPGDAEQSWPVFAELRDAWAGRIDLQAAVLTGSDLGQDSDGLASCADLVARYGGVLGSCTYPGPDQRKEIAAYFAAAEARDLTLDFHVDETM
ncbi:MAG: cytosine deaminase, partial [Pseudomonadota bacterium]